MKLAKLEALGKPYKIYAEILEPGAIEQFVSVMELPDVVKGALMPDAHFGYVLPIGGVVATKGTIYPSFVGYDIGCGMFSVELMIDPLEALDRADEFRDKIMEAVPLGFNKNSELQSREAHIWLQGMPPHSDRVKEAIGKGPSCLGTLGGGNHFIELGISDDDRVWLTIHSGSRSVGHGLASYYMKEAAGTGNPESACPLLEGEDLGRDYIKDLGYGLEFALRNRRLMAYRISKAIGVELAKTFINRNHNHAEKKDGLWIHRKGATHAELGMPGVIPGNMRDGVFIVEGLGNEDSLQSSSHGAGRVLSRSQAKKRISLEEFQETMGGISAVVSEGTIDESPMAYKNIFDVMKLQEDLVKVLHYVKPFVNVKG